VFALSTIHPPGSYCNNAKPTFSRFGCQVEKHTNNHNKQLSIQLNKRTMGRWVTKMDLPRSTCDVVTCDVTANLNIYTGKIKDAFFSVGYPQSTTLRSRISSSEWN
jgi:hypothetical protein